jgi:hypothetical protein
MKTIHITKYVAAAAPSSFKRKLRRRHCSTLKFEGLNLANFIIGNKLKYHIPNKYYEYIYRAIKLICDRVIHGFESVCLLRLICRDLTCIFQAVFIGCWSSSNDIRFQIHG